MRTGLAGTGTWSAAASAITARRMRPEAARCAGTAARRARSACVAMRRRGAGHPHAARGGSSGASAPGRTGARDALSEEGNATREPLMRDARALPLHASLACPHMEGKCGSLNKGGDGARQPSTPERGPGVLGPQHSLERGAHDAMVSSRWSPHARNGPETQEPWRRPIFPKGCPLSIFGAGELNFRVRDGNGCGLSATVTRIPAKR